MQLSVVATLYRSEPHLREFCRRASAAAAVVTDDYEIILVNDGSPDRSLEMSLALQARSPRIRIVDLARHYGHYSAILAGLSHAAGDFVFLIDSDLEERPEWLVDFWRLLEPDPDTDVIYGVQSSRKGGFIERWTGRLYYRALRSVSAVDTGADTTVARLMRRDYVDSLLSLRESPISLDMLFALAGCRQRGTPVLKSSSSRSTYTFRGKAAIGIVSSVVYGAWPAWTMIWTGVALIACSAGAGAYMILAGSQSGLLLQPVILFEGFLGGATLTALGALGIYLTAILAEVRRRPIQVRTIYSVDSVAPEAAREASEISGPR